MVNIKNKNKQTKTLRASNLDPLANIYNLNMLNFNLIFLLGIYGSEASEELGFPVM